MPGVDGTNGAPPEPEASHGITLADHARVSAEIAEGDRTIAQVLARHALSEDAWNEATRFWMMKIAEDTAANGVEAKLAIVYSDEFSRAQDTLASVVEISPEDWATMTVQIQQAGNPAPVLAARNLSQADFVRLARHWAKRLSSNAEENERFMAVYEELQPKP